jgi:hypothetical protein
MESIDDWVGYSFVPSDCIANQQWDTLSLQYVSDELTEQYKDKLNWLLIATNWHIDRNFYEKFKEHLDQYEYILKLREQYGFINVE